MSNTSVGSVYNTIIEEVINSSRVDFEESGVEESALELLRVGWQRKLTQLDVARFPWDPKPDAVPAQAPAQASQPAPPSASTHSQAQFSPQLPLSAGGPPGSAVHQGIKVEPGFKQESNVPVKQEPKQEPGAQQYQNFNGSDNKNSVAANRAAQQLHAQFGNTAARSINAIQDRIGQQPNTQSPQQTPVQLPQSQSQQPLNAAQQQQQQQQQAYRQQMAAATQKQQQRNGQMDGPGDDGDDDDDVADFEGVLMQRNARGDLSELGRVEIDSMLHEQIAAKAKAMEGGGLMLSLKEATRHQTSGTSSRTKGKGVAAFDGGDDDDEEEDDEDAINSDLDDPEDENNDDDVEDDGGLGHIMLCMYDKVQRVKNKWKCVLKDGVLTVNGKEYVFQKATGEFEW